MNILQDCTCMPTACILLPRETDDSQFNSCEKNMLTDSVQLPYDKPIIDLACSVCSVKYRAFIFCMDGRVMDDLSVFHCTDLTLGK